MCSSDLLKYNLYLHKYYNYNKDTGNLINLYNESIYNYDKNDYVNIDNNNKKNIYILKYNEFSFKYDKLKLCEINAIKIS